ncbi:MAG: alpha/beta fold hydrolase [Pseudonocardiaceae bacterium]|nr:alpha/beta fold hydrolase [Pseudonocardiaceae bacterium]
MLFEGFRTHDVDVGGVRIHAVVGGDGPPVLLLHGYPQTHVMWHRVAPKLARDHTVVAADLRGYGDSGKPPGGERHEAYSKRAMAADQLRLMTELGFDEFAIVGHDRGARVAHRLSLDAPGRVSRVAVLDIAPTRHMYRTADSEFARAYYHWFFLIQPYDLPERLIGADPEYFLNTKLGQWGARAGAHTPEAKAEYLRCWSDPATVHASCEDYRAAAGIDLEHDERDERAAHRLTMPLLALWGERGFVGRYYPLLDVWREYADDVRGHGVDCGHFLAEESPAETTTALREFLGNWT